MPTNNQSGYRAPGSAWPGPQQTGNTPGASSGPAWPQTGYTNPQQVMTPAASWNVQPAQQAYTAPQQQAYTAPQQQVYTAPQQVQGQPYQPAINRGYPQNGYPAQNAWTSQPGYGANPYAGQAAGMPQAGIPQQMQSLYNAPLQNTQGSYIPQTNWNTSGMHQITGGFAANWEGQPAAVPNRQGYQNTSAAGGYAAPAGYTAQPGYNAYAQMGRQQPMQQAVPRQEPAQQIPLNGGGYVPPKRPVKRQPFEFDTPRLLILSVLLLALFAAGMFVTGLGTLKWVFAALAAAAVALFWVKPLIPENKRLCFTVVFVALIAVTAVSVLAGGVPAASRNPAAQTDGPDYGGNTPVLTQIGNAQAVVIAAPAEETPAPTKQNENEAISVLQTFFYYWGGNRQEEMLSLCLPSWQSNVDSAKTALFSIMANRTPLDYSMEKISGTDDSTSRTVTMTSTMDRNNGKDPVKYRLSVLMVKEDNAWYVDPRSLKTYEAVETPDDSLSTPTPSPTPSIVGSTVLYYNPDGGTKYHLDPNCRSTHQKYLPMKGQFTWSQVNVAPYSELSPCSVCGAPLRE